MMKTCVHCGREYETGGKRFCGSECYTAHKRRNQVELVCSYCGIKKMVSPGRATTVTHCSRRCYQLHASRCETRTCKSCGCAKAAANFAVHTKGKTIRRRVCVDCFNRMNGEKAKTARARWLHSKSRCLRSEKIWEIDLEKYQSFLLMPCHYCGGPLNDTGCGLDRVNNDKGYIPGNVVPCCRQCNTVKNDFFTYDEMMLLSPVLYQIQRSKACAN